jgi:hypothetical protein
VKEDKAKRTKLYNSETDNLEKYKQKIIAWNICKDCKKECWPKIN